MRILWISFYGSWTKPLLSAISRQQEVTMGVIVPIIGGKSEMHFFEDNIEFFNIPFREKEMLSAMTTNVYHKFEKCINNFKPDIIHVHGTEKNLGQIANYCHEIPVVVSIQGLIVAYRPFYLNFLEKLQLRPFMTIKNILGRGGVERNRKIFDGGKKYEEDIISHCKYFFARTFWDKAHIKIDNKDAKVFHGEELLRDEFYANAGSWNIEDCRPHTIFMPCGMSPIKGLHCAIETIRLLKRFYPDVKLVVPGMLNRVMGRGKLKDFLLGENYIRYVRSLIRKYNLIYNVLLLDRLDGKGMVDEMKKANVFLSPSSIDNSPNAVGEATMIGIPVVTTPVGGIPSFLHDEIECLFAPAGDVYLMAYQIMRLFEDKYLCKTISQNAYKVALKRHDVDNTVNQYMDAYHYIIINKNV